MQYEMMSSETLSGQIRKAITPDTAAPQEIRAIEEVIKHVLYALVRYTHNRGVERDHFVDFTVHLRDDVGNYAGKYTLQRWQYYRLLAELELHCPKDEETGWFHPPFQVGPPAPETCASA